MNANRRFRGTGIILCLLFLNPSVWAQRGTVIDSASFRERDTDAMVDRALATGRTEAGYDMSGDRLQRSLADFVPRNAETGEEEDLRITVFTGERVFCSVCNLLLKDTTTFADVPWRESAGYFDDGTHGDIYEHDGLPSYVENVVEGFICPYCYENKLKLELLRDRATWRDLKEARNLRREPLIPEEPQTFYANLPVLSNDTEDLMPWLSNRLPMPQYHIMKRNLRETVREWEADNINSAFKDILTTRTGEEVYINKRLHMDTFSLDGYHPGRITVQAPVQNNVQGQYTGYPY